MSFSNQQSWFQSFMGYDNIQWRTVPPKPEQALYTFNNNEARRSELIDVIFKYFKLCALI
jgi:hypothetical protein